MYQTLCRVYEDCVDAEVLDNHMKYVLVEAWYAFKVLAGNIIKEIFSKKTLLPISPTNLTTNTQACDASTKVSSVAKAE